MELRVEHIFDGIGAALQDNKNDSPQLPLNLSRMGRMAHTADGTKRMLAPVSHCCYSNRAGRLRELAIKRKELFTPARPSVRSHSCSMFAFFFISLAVAAPGYN